MKKFCFLKNITLLLLAGISILPSAAQESKPGFTKQISIEWDNDYFALGGTDRYYTNGIYLNYKLLAKNSKPGEKKIWDFELGQAIYKQFTRKVWPTVLASNMYPGGIGALDRPITGYLYGKVSRLHFFDKEQLFEYGISVGTIGDNSFGRQTQANWHKASGVGDWWDWVWKYQLESELGVNLHGQFAKSLFKHDASRFFNLTSLTKATLGTSFTDASQSLVLQAGRFGKMNASSYWNSRLQNQKEEKQSREYFFYYAPEIKFQVYNATVQGGLFRDDKGPIVSDPEPVVITHTIGAMYGNNRLSAGAGVSFMSKEAQSQRYNHVYGKVQFAYRLR